MNTSNIDALAIAAETRANEAESRLLRADVMTANNFSKHVFDAKRPPQVPTPSPKAAVPPLPSLPHHNHPRSPPAAPASSNRRRKPTFAEKLHVILSERHLNSIITWLPSGKSFCILDKDRFTKTVLPTYFREAKFDSFSRRIKRWGFRKMYTTGLKQIVYNHELFQKDRLDLCSMMNGRACQTSNGEGTAQDVAIDVAKFEDAVKEQVALAKNAHQLLHQAEDVRQRGADEAPMQERLARTQMPVKKRSVALGPRQGMPYESAMFHPQFQMNGTNQMNSRDMNQITMMSYPQGMAVSDFSRPMLQPRSSSTYYNGEATGAARQLTELDEDIAECEEQLAILHRLKALKERRRVLGR